MLGKYSYSLIDQSIYQMKHLFFVMPEKGWYSLTVKLSTAKMIRGLAKGKKLSLDELLKYLVSNAHNKKWLTCNFCGVE